MKKKVFKKLNGYKEIDTVHTLNNWLPKYETLVHLLQVCKFGIRYIVIIDFGRWFRSYAETLHKSCVVTGVQEPKD